ncbi:hypothetical protein [Heyndrickxia camelliae]|uniref:Uncharacterized protein n=1 Tax=Heyndrickxia camelliae TaxID=1707093 RepID=A0A2N3LDX8_9BACI|nr:hypothetical protein [Heyndrickxia camelliae]PKR82850.1 hypothetical protein CWO92_21915 [Heyndrickxia camelliae]
MTMHKNFMDIYHLLNNDEQLNRLLYYSPLNLIENTPDPLDPSLPNVLDIDEDWEIRTDRILLTPKSDDLTADKSICRILIYPGTRIPTSNYYVADQQLVVDILCHFDYENGDLRSTRISDRLNELFCLNRITGIGKMDYVRGTPIGAPVQYVGYRHAYEFGSFKK